VLFLQDRLAAINSISGRHGVKPHFAMRIMHYGLFLVMLALGTAVPILEAQYELQVENDSTDAMNRLAAYKNATYALSVFWIFAAVDVVMLVVNVRRAAYRGAVFDRVTTLMLKLVAPIYVIMSLADVIFAIVFSFAKSYTLPVNLVPNLIFFGITTVLLCINLRDSKATSGGPPEDQSATIRLPAWPNHPHYHQDSLADSALSKT